MKPMNVSHLLLAGGIFLSVNSALAWTANESEYTKRMADRAQQALGVAEATAVCQTLAQRTVEALQEARKEITTIAQKQAVEATSKKLQDDEEVCALPAKIREYIHRLTGGNSVFLAVGIHFGLELNTGSPLKLFNYVPGVRHVVGGSNIGVRGMSGYLATIDTGYHTNVWDSRLFAITPISIGNMNTLPIEPVLEITVIISFQGDTKSMADLEGWYGGFGQDFTNPFSGLFNARSTLGYNFYANLKNRSYLVSVPIKVNGPLVVDTTNRPSSSKTEFHLEGVRLKVLDEKGSHGATPERDFSEIAEDLIARVTGAFSPH